METSESLSYASAIALQQQLSPQVITYDRFSQPIRYVAGVDVGFQDHYRLTQAAVAVLSFPALEKVECAIAQSPTKFPYIPGLLSFREVPTIIQALEKLHTRVDLILCDGQGIAHPRRFGLACHLGVLLDQPTIGVAKSRLIGRHREVGSEKGAWQPLWDQGEVIGAVLRSRTNVKPVYVSPGHRISLRSAIDVTLACTPKYRLPETTRWADKLASSGKNS
jgi:deoxyribonuclease V